MSITVDDLRAEVWDLRCRLERAERGDESRDVVSGQQFLVVQAECERYRQALTRIADAQSGHWGRIAHEALHPKRVLGRTEDNPTFKYPQSDG